MAKETDKWGTIIQAAQAALFDLGEDNSRVVQFTGWAIEGARDWHMDMAQSIKTKQLTMTDYKAIKTPSDYVDWVKVGIKCGNVIKTFTRDNNLTLHHEIEDGEIVPNDDCEDHTSPDIWELDTTNHGVLFYGTGLDTPLYGLTYKDNGLGYFREHIEAGEIQFRTNLPRNSKILLEYISDGWEPDKTTLIHPYAFKLIKLYVHWKNVEWKWTSGAKNVSHSLVQYREDQYWKEFDRVSWRMFSLTIEDVLEIQREAFVAGHQG